MVASPALVELSSQVDALDASVVGSDERDLRLLVAIHDRLTARVAVAVGEFDSLGGWADSGALSMRSWLVDEGLTSPEASGVARTASKLKRFPTFRAAALSGELSAGQVRIVTRAITARNERQFAEMEDTLVPSLIGLSIAETDRVVTHWRAHADAVSDPDRLPPEPEASLRHSQTLGGRWVTSGAFDLDRGAIIAAALEAADSRDLDQPVADRRAEALVEVCRQFLETHQLDLPARRKPHVSLVVNAELLDDGRHAEHFGVLEPWQVRQYLCDCSISRVVAEKVAGGVSRILDLGRSTDVVSRAQRTALAVRDQGCRYPGCDRPVMWTDAHHIHHWERGGPTDLGNLVLLCRRHHTLIHRHDLSVKLRPDGVLEVTDLIGRVRSTSPPGTFPDPLRS